MMKEDLKDRIELWLKTLGYSYKKELYSKTAKMSSHRPSYKVMADTVLQSIKINNPELGSNEVWSHTSDFVNGMKGNLIANNSYFQSVLKDGLYNPKTHKHHNGVNLLSKNGLRRNSYNYLKNIWISNGKENEIFDFILLINEFPLLLIKIVNGNKSSFESVFIDLEENFEKFPMFFNFNKFILLTNGDIYKLGSLYDFPEEYINFYKSFNNFSENEYFSFKQLGELLSSHKILDFIKKNKNSRQIEEYIKNIEKKNSGLKITSEQRHNFVNERLDKEREDIKKFEVDDELNFLAEFFNPDLEEVLKSENFKKRLKKTREVPDFRENKIYIEEIQNNKNKDVVETFVKANEKLVLKEVNKFTNYQTTSVDFDDMYQFGYIGLLKAVEKFDLSMENEFSTYAIYWIRQTIIRGINDESLVIRIPVHRWDSLSKLRKMENISKMNVNKVDYEWISSELGLSMEKLFELIMIRNTFINNISLDTPVGTDEDTSLGELIKDNECNVEEIIFDIDLRERLEESLETLDPRSRDVIKKRFGLYDGEAKTLEEVGKEYGLTRERIRQIESKALKKLRHPSRSKKLKSYCEG